MAGWRAAGVGEEKGIVAGSAELDCVALACMSNMQYSLDRQYVSYMVNHLARKERLDD
jgi:hypothetical protein